MTNDSPLKAVIVVAAVALVCSILVSAAAVALRPVQELNQLVERSRNVVALSGLYEEGAALSSEEILAAMGQLDARIVNIDAAKFENNMDPAEFDARAAAADPELSVAIPPELDGARLGRRSMFAEVHLVWNDDGLARIILPIHGQGMWSTLYGFIALESDLNTIGALTFYEQAETAGLGDQITRPAWQALWQGRQLFDANGVFRFRVATGSVDESSPLAAHQVDGLTGATVTGNAVTRLVAYWFGAHGYGPFLDGLRSNPPSRGESAQ